MTKIKLYDGWNFIRMNAEKDLTSLTPRRLYMDQCAQADYLHIWVWDGRGARRARQEIYPAYKSKRKPPSSEIYGAMQLWRDLLPHTTAYSIEVPGYEADDVIAHLVNHYGEMRPKEIQILSNDYDLAHLNYQRPYVYGGWKPKDDVKPEEVRLYKTFVGDSADTIAGVPNFGKGAWAAADKAVLRQIAMAAYLERDYSHLIDKLFPTKVRGGEQLKARILAMPEVLRQMWIVTGPIALTTAQLTDNMIRPIHNPQKVEEILRQFLL